MKKLCFIFMATASSLLFSINCFAADPWPGGSGTTITSLAEASGVVWHPERETLFAVQNSGTLVELSSGGTIIDTWPVAGDLEGITLAENDRYLFIGIEHPDSIVEFDLETETLTGKSWDLTAWMTGPDNSGLEGLAYQNGTFLAGLQADGKIYVFDVNLNVSGDVEHLETITPNAAYASDISGLDTNTDTGLTYIVYDAYDSLIELNSSEEIVKHYSLPGNAQEGVALKTNCLQQKADLYIADDAGQIVKYTDYPIACTDADEDGVAYSTDCNDLDASISESRTYYRDADADSLGDAFTTSQVCSLTAPAGYVSNSNDLVDLSGNGRYGYINGANHEFFQAEPSSSTYITTNFYNDATQEVIAVGIFQKKYYVTVARVNGNQVTIARRQMRKKKYQTAEIIPILSQNKFITKFNGKKTRTWKIKASGSFKRS